MSGRYEFRVFAARSQHAEFIARLSPLLSAAGSERTVEVYLFDPAAAGEPGVNVKLRDGRLSLKRLMAVHDGLQQWRPESETFPVGPVRAAQLAALWPLPPAPAIGWPSMARLQDDAERAPGLRVAHVVKQRERFRGPGVQGETVSLEVNGAAMASLALEGERPEAVAALRRALGLSDDRNVSYPRMLQCLAGCGAQTLEAPGGRSG